MGQFKFISIILFLFVFTSKAESHKYSLGLNKFKSCSWVTSGTQLISVADLGCGKNHDVHFKVKKKLKYRATTSESTILRTPYLIKVIDFKIFKNRLKYGIAAFYQIRQYAYLHLYQLF